MCASLILLTGCSQNTNGMSQMDHSKATNPSPGTGMAAAGGGTYIDMPIPENISKLPLFDSTGKNFDLNSLKGKYLVVANFLTSCQEICPMTSANIRDVGEAIKKSGLSNEATAMVLSVDASRDIPKRLAAYKAMYGCDNWLVASGNEQSLKEIWKFFGAPAKKENFTSADLKDMPVDWQTGQKNTYDMVHADLVLIIDKTGHWRWLDLGAPKTTGNIPQKLKDFLSPQGLQNLTKPEEPTWSLSAVTSALTELIGKKIN